MDGLYDKLEERGIGHIGGNRVRGTATASEETADPSSAIENDGVGDTFNNSGFIVSSRPNFLSKGRIAHSLEIPGIMPE